MNPVTAALFNRLNTDANIVSRVGRFDGAPAVFSAAPVVTGNITDEEKDASFPMVVIEDVVEDTPFDTKVSSGREIVQDIACYTLRSGSLVAVDELAEFVRQSLDAELTVSGYSTVLTMVVSGPVPTDGDRVYGRVTTIRLILEE